MSRWITGRICMLVMGGVLSTCLVPAAPAEAGRTTDSKVVVANPTKHVATYLVGKVQKDIRPGKATLLKPRAYPVALQYWSGSSKVGWNQTALPGPGVYVLRLEHGLWRLVPHKVGRDPGPRAAPGRSQTLKRSTGTRARARSRHRVRRYPSFGFRTRWHPLSRTLWSLGWLYWLWRDRDDIDRIWDIIIGDKIDDEIIRDLERDLIRVPHKERREIENALDWLGGMSDRDWAEFDSLDRADWDRAREEIGDQLPDADWGAIEKDWLDATPLPIQEGRGVQELDIGTLEEDVDLGELEGVGLPVAPSGPDVGALLPREPAGVPPVGQLPDLDLPHAGGADVDLGDYGDEGGDYGFDDMGGGGFDDMGGGGGDDFGGGWD